MSKRAFCQQCNKALVACICKWVEKVDNQYFLHVLQDPSETNKAIGTARILELSLNRSHITVGETFEAADFDLNNSFLVFPDEQAESVSHLYQQQRINEQTQFILLDGSWKKAYKLLMSNPFLQSLPKVSINVRQKSAYKIRKSPREDGLSTVEAGYYLLAELENNAEKFVPMLAVFKRMIDFQIQRMPDDIYQRHYVDKTQTVDKEDGSCH